MATKIKGSSIRARLSFVESTYGKPTLDQVFAQLNEDDAKTLQGLILAPVFYPLELNSRLDEAIAKIVGPTDPKQVYRDLGRASAEANLNSIHASFVSGEGPHDTLSRFPSVRKIYYSEGTAKYERKSDNHGVLLLSDADLTEQDNESTAGYFERAIELMGGKSVKVLVASEPRRCSYDCTWQ